MFLLELLPDNLGAGILLLLPGGVVAEQAAPHPLSKGKPSHILFPGLFPARFPEAGGAGAVPKPSLAQLGTALTMPGRAGSSSPGLSGWGEHLLQPDTEGKPLPPRVYLCPWSLHPFLSCFPSVTPTPSLLQHSTSSPNCISDPHLLSSLPTGSPQLLLPMGVPKPAQLQGWGEPREAPRGSWCPVGASGAALQLQARRCRFLGPFFFPFLPS